MKAILVIFAFLFGLSAIAANFGFGPREVLVVETCRPLGEPTYVYVSAISCRAPQASDLQFVRLRKSGYGVNAYRIEFKPNVAECRGPRQRTDLKLELDEDPFVLINPSWVDSSLVCLP